MLNTTIQDEVFCLECMYGEDITGMPHHVIFVENQQEESYTRIEVSLRSLADLTSRNDIWVIYNLIVSLKIRFHLSNKAYPNISPSFEITSLVGIAQSYKATLISELSQQVSICS